jgi:hypothetical protein
MAESRKVDRDEPGDRRQSRPHFAERQQALGPRVGHEYRRLAIRVARSTVRFGEPDRQPSGGPRLQIADRQFRHALAFL